MSQAVGGSKGTMVFAEQKRIRSYGLTEHGWYGKTTKVDLTSVTTRRTRTTRNTYQYTNQRRTRQYATNVTLTFKVS